MARAKPDELDVCVHGAYRCLSVLVQEIFIDTTSERRRDLRPLAVDTALIGNVLSVFRSGNVTTALGFWSFSNA